MPDSLTQPESKRLARLGPFLRERYLTADVRVLALFRVWFGCVLLGDVLRSLAAATMFFSNEGVLSNHFALFSPIARPIVSVYLLFSTPAEVKTALVISALIAILYIAGWKTRLMQVLALVIASGLNIRNMLLENGGVVLVNVVCAWTLFLPLGERFSVDAWLARRRGEAAPTRTSFASIAQLGVLLQLAFIYFLNCVQKVDPAWHQGQAVHWVLWQDRIATTATAWLRLHEPAWFSPLSSWGTLIFEGGAPILLLSPLFQKWLRSLHVALAISFHAGIALLMTLGPFSYAMIALNLLALPGPAMDLLERRSGPGLRRVTGWLEEKLSPTLLPGAVTLAAGAARPPRRWMAFARELSAGLLFFCMGAELFQDNGYFNRLPGWLRAGPPAALSGVIGYPRLLQGWPMFAFAPRDDGTLVVDATTRSGRHVDPLTGAPPDFEEPRHGPGFHTQYLCDYELRISSNRFGGYRDELMRYLRRWPELQGWPASEQFTRIEVYWLSWDSPPFGSTTPTNLQRRLVVASDR